MLCSVCSLDPVTQLDSNEQTGLPGFFVHLFYSIVTLILSLKEMILKMSNVILFCKLRTQKTVKAGKTFLTETRCPQTEPGKVNYTLVVCVCVCNRECASRKDKTNSK